MTLMPSVRRVGGWAAVAMIVAGCEDWTRLEVTPDQPSTAAATETTVATNAVETVAATTETAPSAAAAPTPSGSLGVTGSGGGFLWKPVAESDGKLVVLLPPQYTGSISTCFVASRSGSVIEQGAYGGVHNGGRVHFRFSRPGSAYGTSVYVVADLSDGTTVHWYVANGGSRTEY